MQKTNYRLSVIDDTEVVNTLKDALKDSPFAEYETEDTKLNDLVNHFSYELSEGKRFCLLAYNETETIGLVACSEVEDHFLFKDTGQEMVWWVRDGYRNTKVGHQLFKSLEDWAKARGLKRLLTAHYHNEHTDKMRKLYDRHGYKPVEYNYIKEL
jgi:GNAT superfamily N-acetyltransferase